MKKILIIITRIDGKEFSDYWGFSNEIKFKIIPMNGNSVLFINGYSIIKGSDNYSSYMGEIINESGLIYSESEIGLVSHQGPNPFPTDSWGNNLNLVFKKKYSSTLGGDFCQNINSDFVVLTTKPPTPRTGVLDAFRDSIVFDQNDNLPNTFNNLWNYFKGNAKLNAALEFLHNCLGNNNSVPSLPGDFMNCQTEFNIFHKDRNNQNLRNLRDAMLKEAGVTVEN